MSDTGEKGRFLSAMHRFASLRSLPCFDTGRLTRGEFFCLTIIRRLGRDLGRGRGVYVWELAEKMRVRPPAVSRMLRGLEERELIARSVEKSDRRNTCVSLTPRGEALWSRTERELDAFTDRVIARMGAEDMAVLAGQLEKLCAIIEDERSREVEVC